MRGLFNPERGLWRLMGYFGDAVVLSLQWLLFSIPVVTLGPATAALYDCAVHNLRRGEDDLPGRFWRSFKRDWKIGALSALLWLVVTVTPLVLLYQSARRGASGVVLGALVLLAFFLLALGCWVFPLLSRFTFSFAALQSTAVRLGLGHILRSAALAALVPATLWLCLRFIVPTFFLPAAAALLASLLIEPVFAQYENRE